MLPVVMALKLQEQSVPTIRKCGLHFLRHESTHEDDLRYSLEHHERVQSPPLPYGYHLKALAKDWPLCFYSNQRYQFSRERV
jgi:hypothetical protein